MSDYKDDDLIEIPEDETIELVDDHVMLEDDLATEREQQELAEGESEEGDEGEGSDDPEDAEEEADSVDSLDESEAQKPKPKKKRRDFQERINEITRKQKEAEERAAAAEAKLQLIEEQRLNTEHETKEQALIRKRQEAEDEGDLSTYSKVSDELSELRLEKIQRKSVKPESVAQDAEAGEMNDSAKQWVERNPWFNTNKALAGEVGRLEEFFITEKGMSYGPDLYEKIDKAIASDPRFEDVRQAGNQDSAVVTKPVTRPKAPAKPSPVTVGAQAKKNEAGLTSTDIAVMKQFKLDPSDPKHRESYLSRKSQR